MRTGSRSRGLYAALGAALGGANPGLPELVSLDLTSCTRITDGGLLLLAEGAWRVETLSLAGCVQVGDRGVLAIARNGRLVTLSLDGCRRVSDSAVCALARQCPLANLSAPDVLDVSSFGARALAEDGGETLCVLDLSENPKLDADACVRALCGRCPKLRDLRLNRCARLTDAGLQLACAPGALPNLVALEVDGCTRLSEESRHAVHSAMGMAC